MVQMQMTPRERILNAVLHKESDRIPFDLGGTDVSSIAIGPYRRLCEALKIDATPYFIVDTSQQIVIVDDRVADRIGAVVAVDAGVQVGGVIEAESSLLVADENTFRTQFAIDVRTGCEAIKISPDKKTVELRDVATGEVTTESYDKLVLSPGAPSIRPPLPGIDLPGIFQVRTVPDARAIREWIEKAPCSSPE